jgi:pimeloyl-ACP methyl ester carboxylesterase
MKDEDLFSHDEPAPTTSDQERGGDSDRSALSPASPVSQEALPPAPPPKTERRLTPRHPLWLLLVAMMVVVLVALAGGYGVFRVLSPTSRQATPAFQQTRCPFPLGDGLVEGKNVKCGFLVVPEDRSQPQGPTIRLAVAIFKTSSPHPAPDPVLVLGGGPGIALLENQGPGYNAGNLPSNRDLILLDQRGAGYSQPSLRCLDNETLQACHTRLVKSGINLNAFTTLENVADVHDLIRALGYRQVNLDGISYGTRLALTVMRLYPADLRSVVLNSVVPPQVNLFTSIPQAAERAFVALFQSCAADRSCNATYPHLQAVFYQLVAELNTTPITFQVTSPLSGKSVTVHFTGNDLVLGLRGALYDTSLIPQLPRVLFQMRQHDYTQLASIYGNSIDTTGSIGLFYSVLCGEEMAYTTQHALERSVEGLPSQIQPALLAFGLSRFSICQFWGMKAVPAVQKEPVRSTIPTLILQGEYDPVTPPANGMLAAQTLSKSYFFLFPGVGHGVHSFISTCPDDITQAFLENPTEKPDASCIGGMPEPVFT